MQLLEWSDTQLKFHITETENNTTTNVDLTDYDEVLLTIRFPETIVEIQWVVDNEDSSYVVFDLLSEQTTGRAWWIVADIRWIQWAKKLRFNQSTIQGVILASVKVPQWVVND